MKQDGEKIACLTAYDASFAQLLEKAGVDVVLVGDSLGMVIQGEETTLPVSVEDMLYHTQCVSNGLDNALLITDMPFLLSLIHISEPTRPTRASRMPSSA